jgi:hypothetical protein
MKYKAKVAVCSEKRTKHSKKKSTMENFLMLNLVVSNGTVRLLMVMTAHF